MKRCCRVAILAMLLIAAASADVVTIPLNYVFSGSGSGSLIATFSDTENGVLLTMNASGLSSGQYVSNWAFNLDPNMSPSSLVMSAQSGAVAAVTTGNNFYQADGDGRYDIRFAFGTDSFAGGSTSTYLITCTGCTAQSFAYLSTPPPGAPTDYKGPFYSAVQVQRGPWLGATTVPEPTSYPVYLSVVIGLCAGIFQRVRSRM